MNFGGKITILYLSFVSLIVTLVTLCYKQDVELVSNDYYADEIHYQKRIDAIHNEKQLKNSIQHLVTKNEILFTIDSSLAANNFRGTITLFRPSDSKLDKVYEINFQNHEQKINNADLVRGVYKLQLSWTNEQQNYFKEEVVTIN